jgi:cytochrome P450
MSEDRSPILYDPWDPAFIADPYTRFKPLYNEPPRLIASDRLPRSVRATTPPGAPVAMVARYDDVLAVMRDDTRFGAARPASRKSGEGLGVFGAPPLVFTDPPVHTRLRRLVGRAFSPRRVREMEPTIRAMAHELLDRIALTGRGGAAFDLMTEFANPLPTMVIAKMLGVPASDYEAFKIWSDTVQETDFVPPGAPFPPRILQARDAMRAYFTEQIDHHRRVPADDLIGLLITAEEGDVLTSEEVLSFVILLLMAGNETTATMLGNGWLALGRNPDQLDLLRANRALAPGAIEEMLRYDPPLQATVRHARMDTEISGTRIPAGTSIFVLLAAANRDPAKFERPEVFDITRDPNDHLSLGEGIHFCLGAGLARLEGAVAIAAMLERFPNLHPADPGAPVNHRASYFIRCVESLPMALE